MSLDKWLWFSLKILFVVLILEFVIIFFYSSGDNEEEYNSYLPNPIEQL